MSLFGLELSNKATAFASTSVHTASPQTDLTLRYGDKLLRWGTGAAAVTMRSAVLCWQPPRSHISSAATLAFWTWRQGPCLPTWNLHCSNVLPFNFKTTPAYLMPDDILSRQHRPRQISLNYSLIRDSKLSASGGAAITARFMKSYDDLARDEHPRRGRCRHRTVQDRKATRRLIIHKIFNNNNNNTFYFIVCNLIIYIFWICELSALIVLFSESIKNNLIWKSSIPSSLESSAIHIILYLPCRINIDCMDGCRNTYAITKISLIAELPVFGIIPEELF